MTKSAYEKIRASLEKARAFAQGRSVKGFRVHRRRVASNAVAAVRLKTGLTQSEFAKLLGASVGTIRKWETGERVPSGAAATLLRLIDAKPKLVKEALGIAPSSKRSTQGHLFAAE
jgi:putative transcriptional regulator